MSGIIAITSILAATFLLLCWIVVEYQIGQDVGSMGRALNKVSLSARFRAWQIRITETIYNARFFKQENLKEKNKTTFLFGTEKKNQKEERRMDERER